MRVNDALNCGAPSIVGRGMGAHKLVLDYGLGATFHSGDAVDLAWQIRNLCEDQSRYQAVCENLHRSRLDIFPDAAASRVVNRLGDTFYGWRTALKL